MVSLNNKMPGLPGLDETEPTTGKEKQKMITTAIDTFDGITDPSASEWFAENTKDALAVQRYATGSLNAHLSDADAETVLAAIKIWQAYDGGEGQNFLHYLRAELAEQCNQRMP
jgi:arginine decarboxylase-like protein